MARDAIRDLTDDEARRALPLKWGAVPVGTVPAWVAEMDYAPAPAVTEALRGAVEAGTTGYAPFGDLGVGAALSGFARRHWGLELPAEASIVTGDVISAIRLALDTLCPAGPVVVPLPCYPPFRTILEICARELAAVETDPDDHEAELDLAAVEAAFRAGARTFLLCNPHNPLGRVWTRGELEALRDLTRQYDVRVVADEIHGPLVLPGATFTPYLSIDPTAILVTSASKAFNTPGLHCAQLVTLDAVELARLRALPMPLNHAFTTLGMLATTAAWNDCDGWLAALVGRLDEQRRTLAEALDDHLPKARMRRLEATYLAWLDLREYGVDDPAAVGERYGVKVAPGTDYHPGRPGHGHVRINIATSPERTTLAVQRLAQALEA